MGSILDVTFKPYLQRQINARQDIVNMESRDARFLQYTNAKNSWCRMTSLVNYNSPDGRYKGQDLSRKYILEAGTLVASSTDPNKFALRRGVGNSAGSYGGNLGDHSYGLRPMPGITSIDIKNKGAYGSLKEAEVKFFAWDKGQMDDLEILFMRTGYSVLLEYGWSIYLDTFMKDSGSMSSQIVDRLPLASIKSKTFIDPTINAFDDSLTPQDVYAKLEFLRHKFSGNYDGMVAKIRNFTMKQLPNGGFECSTILISIGDVLDSLKINSSTYPLGTNSQDNSPKTNNRLLTRFEQIFLPVIDYSNASLQRDYIVNNVIGKNLSKYQKVPAKGDQDPNIDFGVYSIFYNSPSPFISDGKKNLNGNLHYISMGSFIAIMNTQFNLFDPRQGRNIPLVDIEVPYPGYGAYGNGLCICSEDTISIDPTVCLINNPYAKFTTGDPNGFNPNVAAHNVQKITFNPFQYGTAKNVAIIANIYLCVEFIVNKFRDLASTSDGTVDMHKFIQAILDEVSFCMGSVNEFGFYVDDSSAAIIDTHFVEDPTLARNNRFVFNYLGTNSVVRDFNINSKIFASQATMIAIGAQNRENISAVQTSTYNLLNKGLTDRLVLQSLDADAINTLDNVRPSGSSPADVSNQQDLAYKEQLARMVLDLRTYVQSYLSKSDLSQVYANKQAANSNLNSTIVKINTDTNFKALIPISVELVLDGIGGMTIGNVFRLNPDTLPKDYVNKNMAFRVVGIGQHIANSDWVTTVTTQACLLNQDDLQLNANNIDKNDINSSISGIQMMRDEAEMNAIWNEIHVYNNLIKLIAAIFGPNNPTATNTINGLVGNVNMFQLYTSNCVSFTFDFTVARTSDSKTADISQIGSLFFLRNVDYTDPGTTYNINSTSFSGYPTSVIKNFLLPTDVSDFLNDVKVTSRETSGATLKVGATQYVLNPFSSEYLMAGDFVNTLVKSYPDYNSISDPTLRASILQALLDIQFGLSGRGGTSSVNSGNIMLPLFHKLPGKTTPILFQNIPLNVRFSATTNFTS